MGKMFDDDGKVKPGALGAPGLSLGRTRKVTDESNEKVWAHRVESDTERSLNITPRTVDFKMVEA